MDSKLLDILACPATRQPLLPLEARGLEALNAAIAAGGVRRQDGTAEPGPLREALVKLTGDALAVAEGQRGFWVSQISLDELQDTMNTRLLITDITPARVITCHERPIAEREPR